MRRIGAALPSAGIIILALAMAGCQQLFTTSLGKQLNLVRPSVSLPSNLSGQQAVDLVSQAKAEGDTKLAAALVSNLQSQIASLPAGAAKTELQTAAASAAIVASGASSTLLSLLPAVAAGETPTQAEISALVKTIQGGATPEVIAALKYLNPSNAGGGVAPSTITGTSTVNATDYLIAAVVIAATSSAVEALPADADVTKLTPAQVTTLQGDADVQAAIGIANAGNTVLGSTGDKASQDLVNQFTALLGSP